ncbi:MAG: acylphosphatase [Bryobacterales bacterium]
MASDFLTRRYVITGRVQGVGFRYFVQRKGLEIGVTGWVRNRPDGSVEAVAGGPTEAMEAFEQALRDGPPLSRVDHVADSPAPAIEGKGFRITA